MAAAWNEIHHINVNDMRFALGLRGGAAFRRSGEAQGRKHGRNPKKGRESQDIEGAGGGEAGCGEGGDETDGEGSKSWQLCKSEGCLEREKQLEVDLMRRSVAQEVFMRVKRRKAASSARTTASETARDDKAEELRDVEGMLQTGIKTLASLQVMLSSAKAQYAALEQAMHDLSADRARLRREEVRESMPAHLRLRLPSYLSEARRDLNFSSPPSRLRSGVRRRPETVFAILEDGMPGGRLETREAVEESAEVFSGERMMTRSSPSLRSEGVEAGIWPTTPPRCRPNVPKLAVSPIQSGGEVGDVKTLDEEETMSRRDRQRARLQARVAEWWRAGGGNGDDQLNKRQQADCRSMTSSTTGADRRKRAWGSPSKLPLTTSPLRLPRRVDRVQTM